MPQTSQRDMYDPAFVSNLFADMSRTYHRMNTITSFGFSSRWRRQCAADLALQPGMHVVDLMCGMGEAWPYVLPKIGETGRLTAVDFCADMLQAGRQKQTQFPGHRIDILLEDALASSIPDRSADAVISTFGLKTLHAAQLSRLAAEMYRMLRPGGTFALIEVSAPGHPLLRYPYLFYLKIVIPWLGRLFLGNPDTYRMLGVYTSAFGDCRVAAPLFEQAGLEVCFVRYFGGCASGLTGVRP